MWFEIKTNLNFDERRRYNGSFNIISDSLNTTEQVLKVLIANNDLSLSNIPLIQRMINQESKKVVRIDGRINKGFLYIFKERLSRVKPFTLNR